MSEPSDLTDAQRAFFAERGYLVVDRITTADEIEWLRGRYDDVFARRVGDCARRTRPPSDGGKLRSTRRPGR
jgi:hypothetical protein